ncbi:hypothetical protein BR63_03255 [Thermanaerosceptrum fracticalcis]|uniref:Uncharacterized protein n=1 Tax=Thermanaerosceptrum fracticalcis TaxID=1712410 RepID=A0A7G6E014_THEFR|nr:hypothetical protein [Thermanaerosceptrum fracticalcis]QNB45418.1 hypothetical protein BR63_03255 [Thermanaerosceptrum fracticalcis]
MPKGVSPGIFSPAPYAPTRSGGFGKEQGGEPQLSAAADFILANISMVVKIIFVFFCFFL